MLKVKGQLGEMAKCLEHIADIALPVRSAVFNGVVGGVRSGSCHDRSSSYPIHLSGMAVIICLREPRPTSGGFEFRLPDDDLFRPQHNGQPTSLAVVHVICG